ncbi:hypothetical protein DUNSADRAFT_17338 [Dunaliella salina]|uniref:Uncharacterized protein n=1 Tax=Dunaliella salina TaxID=3046 RepID=A0ABQ7H056_DUNSA|nr:hypothetical protein DUNSADRAFT_17338 [Dunaliella salina]|eukprot:KAF5840235.1 hypothetical protein DUNSADRAFT_17338 [Dunaliella salina]
MLLLSCWLRNFGIPSRRMATGRPGMLTDWMLHGGRCNTARAVWSWRGGSIRGHRWCRCLRWLRGRCWDKRPAAPFPWDDVGLRLSWLGQGHLCGKMGTTALWWWWWGVRWIRGR